MARLTTNIGSLYALQIANYVLPLVTLPYLVRVLGIGDYGVLAFVYSLVQYFVIVTDYGFNLSATREVAQHRNDPEHLSQIVSAVLAIKIALMILSAVGLSAIVLLVPEFRANWSLYAVAFSLVIGNVLFPVWLYQGLERMPAITVLSVGAKALAAVGVFIFVQTKNDLVTAVFLQSAGGLFAGIGSALMLRWLSPSVRLCLPPRQMVQQTLFDGWHIFLSQVFANLVNSSNVFILGIFHGSQNVGQFALAEKIVKAALNLQAPICNAIYPKVGALYRESAEKAKTFLRSVVRHFLPVAFAVSLCLLFGANLITRLIAGVSDPEVAFLIRVMSLLPITVFLDNIYGTQVLLNLGHRRPFMSAILYSGLLAIGLSLAFVPQFGARASACVYLATELLLLGLMLRHVRLLGADLWKRASA